MSNKKWLLCAFLIISLTNICYSNKGKKCPRVHKAWHLSTDQERQLFIDGYHKLNEQGKIARLSDAYRQILNLMQGQWTSAFFAWHRYFNWEVKISLCVSTVSDFLTATNNISTFPVCMYPGTQFQFYNVLYSLKIKYEV